MFLFLLSCWCILLSRRMFFPCPPLVSSPFFRFSINLHLSVSPISPNPSPSIIVKVVFSRLPFLIRKRSLPTAPPPSRRGPVPSIIVFLPKRAVSSRGDFTKFPRCRATPPRPQPARPSRDGRHHISDNRALRWNRKAPHPKRKPPRKWSIDF